MREQEVDLASHPPVSAPPLPVKSGIHCKLWTGYHPSVWTLCHFRHFSLGNGCGHFQVLLASLFLLDWKNSLVHAGRSPSL